MPSLLAGLGHFSDREAGRLDHHPVHRHQVTHRADVAFAVRIVGGLGARPQLAERLEHFLQGLGEGEADVHVVGAGDERDLRLPPGEEGLLDGLHHDLPVEHGPGIGRRVHRRHVQPVDDLLRRQRPQRFQRRGVFSFDAHLLREGEPDAFAGIELPLLLAHLAHRPEQVAAAPGLHNRLVEQPSRGRRGHQRQHAHSAGRFAEDCDVLRVSPERGNVSLDPLQRRNLVHEGVISERASRALFRQRRMGEEAEPAEAVVEADKNDALFGEPAAVVYLR